MNKKTLIIVAALCSLSAFELDAGRRKSRFEFARTGPSKPSKSSFFSGPYAWRPTTGVTTHNGPVKGLSIQQLLRAMAGGGLHLFPGTKK